MLNANVFSTAACIVLGNNLTSSNTKVDWLIVSFGSELHLYILRAVAATQITTKQIIYQQQLVV